MDTLNFTDLQNNPYMNLINYSDAAFGTAMASEALTYSIKNSNLSPDQITSLSALTNDLGDGKYTSLSLAASTLAKQNTDPVEHGIFQQLHHDAHLAALGQGDNQAILNDLKSIAVYESNKTANNGKPISLNDQLSTDLNNGDFQGALRDIKSFKQQHPTADMSKALDALAHDANNILNDQANGINPLADIWSAYANDALLLSSSPELANNASAQSYLKQISNDDQSVASALNMGDTKAAYSYSLESIGNQSAAGGTLTNDYSDLRKFARSMSHNPTISPAAQAAAKELNTYLYIHKKSSNPADSNMVQGLMDNLNQALTNSARKA